MSLIIPLNTTLIVYLILPTPNDFSIVWHFIPESFRNNALTPQVARLDNPAILELDGNFGTTKPTEIIRRVLVADNVMLTIGDYEYILVDGRIILDVVPPEITRVAEVAFFHF